MRTKRTNVSTPRGFAQMIARGIADNFDPKHQAKEAAKLVELFHDLAMARSIITDARIGRCPLAVSRLAESDVDWLESIADELDEIKFSNE
jgi:hypothetical protein